MKISWWKVDFDESDVFSLTDAVKSRSISMGKITEQLENELGDKLNVPYVVACSSGSAALLMTMIAAKLNPGDEIILSNRNWIASLNAAKILGLKITLAEINPGVPTMDLKHLESKININTKVIIPTPLNGRAENLYKIKKLAKKYNLLIIEDAAQGLFSRAKKGFIGTQSRFNTFSMGITKLLPSGQGGFITTRNEIDYQHLKLIRNNGVVNKVGKNPYQCLGLNFKITDLQSAIALNHLNKVSEKKDALIKIYKIYEEGLRDVEGIEIIPVNIHQGELPLYIEVLVENRDLLFDELSFKQIETRIVPESLHRSPLVKTFELFPNSERLEKNGLILPSGPNQKLDDIEFVIQTIKSQIKEVRKKKSYD